jgi:hypothetical protein
MNGDENGVNGRFIAIHGDFIDFKGKKPLRQLWSAGIVHAFIPLP